MGLKYLGGPLIGRGQKRAGIKCFFMVFTKYVFEGSFTNVFENNYSGLITNFERLGAVLENFIYWFYGLVNFGWSLL